MVSLSLIVLLIAIEAVSGFFAAPVPRPSRRLDAVRHHNGAADSDDVVVLTRRLILQSAIAAAPFFTQITAAKADFTPGGTLVDYAVGIQIGNPLASASRKADNTNVLFAQDYYLKFGTAPPFINDDSFPKTTPFVPVKQRYEALKKYRDRVQRGISLLLGIGNELNQETPAILDENAPEYSIRPMGLLANSFFASENTGTTNELFLARWYINELVLDVADVRMALASGNKPLAKERYAALVLSLRSYLQMMNRQINDKVGEKFDVPDPVKV